MFARRLDIRYIRVSSAEDGAKDKGGPAADCPIGWIDNFAMRNFTNDAIFDDTLPVADGLLEVGYRVPLDRLQVAMTDWFRRKGYLQPGDMLVVTEKKHA